MRWRLDATLFVLTACLAESNRLVEGAVCGTTRSYCDDEVHAWSCHRGMWELRSCQEWCAQQGQPDTYAGCLHSRYGDGCWCQVDPEACVPGQTQCVGPDAILACHHGAWSELRCTDVCASTDLTPVSLGCRADPNKDVCYCSGLAETCQQDSLSRCEGDRMLLQCVDGRWQAVDCDARCAPLASLGCEFDEREAACSCVEQPTTGTSSGP